MICAVILNTTNIDFMTILFWVDFKKHFILDMITDFWNIFYKKVSYFCVVHPLLKFIDFQLTLLHTEWVFMERNISYHFIVKMA